MKLKNEVRKLIQQKQQAIVKQNQQRIEFEKWDQPHFQTLSVLLKDLAMLIDSEQVKTDPRHIKLYVSDDSAILEIPYDSTKPWSDVDKMVKFQWEKGFNKEQFPYCDFKNNEVWHISPNSFCIEGQPYKTSGFRIWKSSYFGEGQLYTFDTEQEVMEHITKKVAKKIADRKIDHEHENEQNNKKKLSLVEESTENPDEIEKPVKKPDKIFRDYDHEDKRDSNDLPSVTFIIVILGLILLFIQLLSKLN